MKLKNYTPYDSDLLREIIRFVCPPGVAGFDISFKNSARSWRGRAYVEGCSCHCRPCMLVIIGCQKPQPPEARKICRWNLGGAYLEHETHSDTEALVDIVAHELRHLWQRKHPRGYRVWGAKGKYSERDADAYAIRMLRAWRRRN